MLILIVKLATSYFIVLDIIQILISFDYYITIPFIMRTYIIYFFGSLTYFGYFNIILLRQTDIVLFQGGE